MWRQISQNIPRNSSQLKSIFMVMPLTLNVKTLRFRAEATSSWKAAQAAPASRWTQNATMPMGSSSNPEGL